jgi:putative copper resistance protein D
MENALIFCRFLHFGTLMTLAGGTVLFPVLTAGAVPGFWRPVRIGLAVAVAVTTVAWLLLLSAVLVGDWLAALDPASIGAVLFDTQFGHLWLWRLGFAAALVLISPWQAPTALLSALLLASLALTGHAVRESGIVGLLHEANQAVHLIAAGLWIGGLGVLAATIAWGRRDGIGLLDRALRRFSGLGYTAVGAILATGIVNIRFVIDTRASFANTAYGIVLLVKIILVMGMLALAMTNRFVLTSALASAPAATRRRLLWSVGIELALGLAVVAAVSVLGTLSPPSDG